MPCRCPSRGGFVDRDHVKFVATHACLICGRQPADAHHLRFMQSRALGRKVSDEFTVPLCRGHHREVHRSGDEATWWKKNRRRDPTTTARTLWLRTHPLPAQPKTSRANYETEPTERPGMTTFRQIEANRRNALKSTNLGPKTKSGKRRCRRKHLAVG